MNQAPKNMDPAAAAEVLRQKLTQPDKPMTVADASVASGLALRDAEAGLTWLTQEYRGHLRVTEDGDLVHVFPHGFTKPWESREALSLFIERAGRALAGAGRFVVRAWLLIAMASYALLFVGLIVALMFARSGSSDNRDTGWGVNLFAVLVRAMADALFWTFHPFSPVYIAGTYDAPSFAAPASWSRHRGEHDVPFYEKINRFVFGPPVPAPDPHAMRGRLLEEIRAQKGRIGLADVMRVTGLPREHADPLMARLMLDYEGTVEVGEQGGILYRFEALRRTAEGGPAAADQLWAPAPRRPRPAWEMPNELPPLTGNSEGANIAIAALNAFNLLASSWVIAHGLTLSNIGLVLSRQMDPDRLRHVPLVLPNDGLPIAFGLVPLMFSLVLFALPAVRAFLRTRKEKSVARENARLAILREILARAPSKVPVPDEALRTAYRVATGEEPTSQQITARVVELGGDVDVGPQGEVRYRFADLEAEAEALEEDRARASEREARLGRVVFASDE
ncbi:hypothetical protein [Pendulispora albinea]|uniref:DUF2207 domain-containing protein n=1 Tax=Pendulispora albinea TaxID=2741071 RepID=A0ABZ2M3G9_9BACT